jgi:MtrB/PioB family decaheme-associated outer membrane protein
MAIVAGLASNVWASDVSPRADVSPIEGWYYNGELEAGARVFIQRPPSGFGKNSSGNFLLPTQTDSRAKFEEYGKIPPGLFLNWINLDAGSKDGRYSFNIWGKDVGVNSQSYGLDVAQNGFQYFNVGWDQTPHLYSTSAKSLFSGVGSTNLTVSDPVQNALQAQYNNAALNTAAGLAARNAINNIINSNSTHIDEIGTRRDTFSSGYRITPTPDWDFNFDYAHEKRTGTKPGTLNYTYPAGFPSNVIGVPVPVDDTTQKPKASGEYAGTGPWGKYSVKLAYGGSIYTDNITQLNVENPFSNTGAVANFGTLRLGLPPSNQAHSLSASGATDIPVFKSRFTTTNQWSRMTQNDAFLSGANNGLAVDPLPATSLNGEVTSFLTNNILTSKLNDNVWNTLRVRQYERNNNTAELTFGNKLYADSEVNAGPSTPEYLSYKKTNIGEGLKWNMPIRGLTMGTGYDFERWDRTNRFTNVTNEHTGKIFADYSPTSWAKWRNSYDYGARRYDGTYFIDDSSWLNARMFDLANRNRQKAKTELDIVWNQFVTITPSAGLRWDDYPESTPNQMGVQSDHSWNVGFQVGVTPTPDWRLMAGYTYERSKLDMRATVADADGAGAGNKCSFPGYAPITFDSYTTPPACAWSDRLGQNYHTFLASAEWKAIPNKLDVQFDYMASWSRESHDYTPCTLVSGTSYNCNGISSSATGVTGSQVGLPWPDNTSLYQRFNVTGRYFVDPDVVRQMGWKGQIVAKLRYTYERNGGSSWQSDAVNSYFGTLTGNNELTGTSRSIWLGYNNPYYTAQIIAMSVAFKW